MLQIKRTRRAAASQAPPATTPAEDGGPKPLTVLSIVCRAHMEIAGLPHVARSIDELLGFACCRWTLENVLDSKQEERSMVRLLDRLLVHEWSGLGDAFRVDRFVHGVNDAGAKNKLQVVDCWLTKYLPVNEATVKTITERAIDWNHVHVLEKLEQRCVLPEPKGLVIECRHADTALWFHDRGYSLSVDVSTEIGQNNLEFVKWIYDHKHIHIFRGLEQGIEIAASINSVEMARWLYATFPQTVWNDPDEWKDETFDQMDWDEPSEKEPSKCDLAMVKWLEENFAWRVFGTEGSKDSDDSHSSDSSDDYGSLYGSDNSDNSSKSCKSESIPDSSHKRWINSSMMVAAKAGQLDTVKYLCEHSLQELSFNVVYIAAENRQFEIVKWFYERQDAYSLSSIGFAVKGGNFEIVKWLHELTKTRPLTAFERGVPGQYWKCVLDYSIDMAAKFGSLEQVKWLHINRPSECTTDAMDIAAAKGKLDIVQWLYANRLEGCTDRALREAIRNGHLAVVQWLLKNPNCSKRISFLPINVAAIYGQLDILKWLLENRSEICLEEAVDLAMSNGHLKILEFLVEIMFDDISRSEYLKRNWVSGPLHSPFKRIAVISCAFLHCCFEFSLRNLVFFSNTRFTTL